MKLIDGKAIAQKIENQIKKSAPTPSNSPSGRRRKYGLAAILVGDDRPSHLYVALKEKAAKRVGIKFDGYLYPTSPSLSLTKERDLENKIINKIKSLNKRKDITGIIVQLPLPKNLDTDKIISAIDPKKDVDGYHPENLAKFQRGEFPFFPPVLGAVIEILKDIKIKKYKNIKMVLVSNSKIFPVPFQAYFGKNLTVCKFKNIKKCLPSADIVITAVGKKHYLKSGLVKKGAGIIDIGIVREVEPRTEGQGTAYSQLKTRPSGAGGKKIFGDADPVSLAKKCGWLTPVPGGVGPVTVACLLKNTSK